MLDVELGDSGEQPTRKVGEPARDEIALMQSGGRGANPLGAGDVSRVVALTSCWRASCAIRSSTAHLRDVDELVS